MNAEPEVLVSRVSMYPLEEYDAYVAMHPDASPYHRSAWLEATARAYNHPGWLITVHRGGTLCGVLPLVEVRPPFGSRSLVSLPFCDLGGPLADDDNARCRLLEEVRTFAASKSANVPELREGGAALEKAEQCNDEAPPRKVRMLCPLSENSDALFKSYKPKLRSQIRKAEKNGLRAEIRTDIGAVNLFYQVFAGNMRRLGSPVHSRKWFHELKQAYGDQMIVGLVFLDDQPVGAGIVLNTGPQACIPWASTLEQYNHLAPNMLLYWSLLSHVCDQGCNLFDFGRSTIGEGTYRFKKQWGAKPYALPWTDQPGKASRLRPFIESVWRRLPLGVANWVGPKLRRYITL
ncbi:MAG: FemAB family XrtA/PEP-CTERM system-associated protein [Marinobacter sp.]